MPQVSQSAEDQSVARLTQAVRNETQRIGFDLVGIAPAVGPTSIAQFREWVEQGFDGEMHYIKRRLDAYEHPSHVLPPVRSVVVVGANYMSQREPDRTECGYRVANYAQGVGDYHTVLKSKLQQLADFLHQQRPGCRTRPVVDTAPLLERDYARLAGLGWFGKNTMLINKRRGSFLFLGALLTDLALEPDQPHETAHCGTCTRCLDACPTQAFVGPYVLDARRCISYLTIELRDDPIPEELRSSIGDWVFGCDICQDVCPWNRHEVPASFFEFQPQHNSHPRDLKELLSLTDEQFARQLAATPMERAGRRGLVRNAAIVAGNSGDEHLLEPLRQLLNDPDDLVRDAAQWAVARLEERIKRPS